VAKGYGAAEWRDDLRRVLKRAGVEGRDCVFLLADTQIIQEGFLEDVNNILNAGANAAGCCAFWTLLPV
jgi:dynein heavy chain